MAEVYAFFAGLLIVGVTAFLAGMGVGYTKGFRDSQHDSLETHTEERLGLDAWH